MGKILHQNGSQTLLIDADDTLWANNVYFERAIANFISYLNHQEYTPKEVRQVLNEVERECIVKHGYGLHSFAHALADTFERLSLEPITPAIHEIIHGLAHEIASHPLEVFDGVPDTLDYLAGRHHLIMVTKGNVAEQSGKIERSGLKDYFSAVEIVAEKDTAAYRSVVGKYALIKDQTWMIGNSPVSDINPALAVGLNAVFIPNDMTWVLEDCEVQGEGARGKLLVVEKFADLRQHF
ncbi:MAG: HAD family hydrolase [Terriglobales bacterium]